jgi:hypothetical protein
LFHLLPNFSFSIFWANPVCSWSPQLNQGNKRNIKKKKREKRSTVLKHQRLSSLVVVGHPKCIILVETMVCHMLQNIPRHSSTLKKEEEEINK